MVMNEKWIRDTGIVFALLFLIIGLRGHVNFLYATGVMLAIVLFVPSLLTPLAWAWMKIAEILGFVMNRVFFGIVFFVVVVPVGFLKRLVSGDARDLERQPQRSSAFIDREKVFEAKDLKNPF